MTQSTLQFENNTIKKPFYGIPVPNYTDGIASSKVMKHNQSYTGVDNKTK